MAVGVRLRHAKNPKLEISSPIHKDVLGFDVSVYNLGIVAIAEPLGDGGAGAEGDGSFGGDAAHEDGDLGKGGHGGKGGV